MLTSQIFDHAARLRSYEIAAGLLQSLPHQEVRASGSPGVRASSI
jgi:hypothetical protein